jgi:hypothetical protein
MRAALRSLAIGFSMNTGLPRLARPAPARSAAWRWRPLAHRIRPPAIAIALGDTGGADELPGARRVAAGERNYLATRVGAERRQLDAASVIGADNAETDHVRKRCEKYRFRRAPGMDSSQIAMLRKGA